MTWAAETTPLEELKTHPEVLTKELSQLDVADRKYSAFVVGPGLGSETSTSDLIERLVEANRPTILDADALTALAKGSSRRLPSHWLLTPHTGEMSRLLGIPSEEIEQNRFESAKKCAAKFGCLILLKGFRTVIASDKKCVIVHSGNPALAKAGTGDVLAGMIGGFLAQGLTIWKAAALGAFLYGKLADDWVRAGKDISSLVASDLALQMPETLASLRAGRRAPVSRPSKRPGKKGESGEGAIAPFRSRDGIVLLSGPMGAGKTQMVQWMLAELRLPGREFSHLRHSPSVSSQRPID